jgi:ferric-dicitrate binding protein FerR (iron transport regulator)
VNQTQREAAVRRLLETAPPVVPPDLYARAVRRGGRMLRRRRALLRLLWLVLCAAAVAFAVWAATVHPWVEPPSDTTPPLTGW